jgi:hypothetical protein
VAVVTFAQMLGPHGLRVNEVRIVWNPEGRAGCVLTGASPRSLLSCLQLSEAQSCLEGAPGLNCFARLEGRSISVRRRGPSGTDATNPFLTPIPSDKGSMSYGIVRLTSPPWAQSAESAIGFGRPLQRREIAGLKVMGSFSIPTAPTNHPICFEYFSSFARRQKAAIRKRASRVAPKALAFETFHGFCGCGFLYRTRPTVLLIASGLNKTAPGK